MFDRFFYSILGFYCLPQGVFTIITKKIIIKGFKTYYDNILLCVITSIVFFIFGIFCLYLAFQPRVLLKNPEFAKCPKYKKSYHYKDTNNGICPICNIKAIKTEEYYKKFPEELKDNGI
jgi:hypothetical protein